MQSYFQYLIWMMIFVIVIEMFFPDSSYRKYMKLVLGCILIYTMLSPIIKLLHVRGNAYESYVKQYQSILSNNGSGDYEEIYKEQQESLKAMYKESIKAYVEKNFEVGVVDVWISWEGDELSQIQLTVGRQVEYGKIGEIRIGDKSNTVDGDEEILKNKIKTCLSDFYNVQVGNIYITVQKN